MFYICFFRSAIMSKEEQEKLEIRLLARGLDNFSRFSLKPQPIEKEIDILQTNISLIEPHKYE